MGKASAESAFRQLSISGLVSDATDHYQQPLAFAPRGAHGLDAREWAASSDACPIRPYNGAWASLGDTSLAPSTLLRLERQAVLGRTTLDAELRQSYMSPTWPRTLAKPISISTSISTSASATASSDILPSSSAISSNAALPVPTAVDGTESHFAVVALATVLGLILLSIAIFFVGRQIGVSLFIGQHEFGRERIGLRNRRWDCCLSLRHTIHSSAQYCTSSLYFKAIH
uniref:Uncharacterized protein n=1 Tax=Mycena chlorophos TaxID=658473 RepID=A0ABQ0L8S9_MYCCL|nr:predicted protein [Mycena chlorophos]